MTQNENTAPSQASWVGFLLPPLVVLAAGFLWVAASRDAPRGGTPAGTRQALKIKNAVPFKSNACYEIVA